MAKLKFDRVINITLTNEESAYVPRDEVWKGTLVIEKGSEINGLIILPDNTSNLCLQGSITLGGGCSIRRFSSGKISFTGVAFKVIS
ncbi:hypothetical protein ACQRC6_06205 [Peptoniphilus sp. SGI.035]|uniref:hypothetical protein n=1 Tax=Peptoniphilus sp. SGI.035 TaxID=3420564 RepID=UPI003D033CCB